MHEALLRALAIVVLCFPFSAESATRSDFSVETEDGFTIFVRRIVSDGDRDRGPFLLLNGGRPGVLASWDVDKPAPSTAALIAEAGHTVYLMDARGYGRSEFPEAMIRGKGDGPLAVRSHEVVRDIKAVVAEIKRRHPRDQRLTALGWATGSLWLAHFASLYPRAISHLVYYQSVYGGSGSPWKFQSIADPSDATLLDRRRFAAFRCATKDSLTARLAQDIDNPVLVERYAQLALEGDERAFSREPPCVRVPSGSLEDTLMMVNGRPYFDAASIVSRVLILRSEKDFWSRPEDAATFEAHLRNASSVNTVVIPGASHYVHLFPDGRRKAFLAPLLAFTQPLGNDRRVE